MRRSPGRSILLYGGEQCDRDSGARRKSTNPYLPSQCVIGEREVLTHRTTPVIVAARFAQAPRHELLPGDAVADFKFRPGTDRALEEPVPWRWHRWTFRLGALRASVQDDQLDPFHRLRMVRSVPAKLGARHRHAAGAISCAASKG